MENNTEVVFENIEQRILQEIKDAHYAIFVSVAWFTNKKLFQALLEKANSNCYVSIIIQLDEINSQSGIDYSQIRVGRSECFMISKDAELLHDKFCVIDFRKVITGSYNWTYKAAHNSENILVLNDPSVATQYITRFEQQKAKYNTTSVQHNSQNLKSFQIQSITNVASLTTKKCEHCKNEIANTDTFCPWCGKQQGESNIERCIICKHCSNKEVDPILDGNTFYCTNCGRKIIQEEILTETCPICRNKLKKGKFCPSCGLPKQISSPFIGGYQSLPRSTRLQNARPEFQLFEQYQRCPKCKSPNLFGVNFCKKCGKVLSMNAEDRNCHGWVDLGLSVLWSTETMWGFYAWMDTTPFSDGGYNGSTSFTKQNMKDVASERWGCKWRIPTKDEFEELLNKCTWECVFVSDQTEVVTKQEMHIREYGVHTVKSGNQEFIFANSFFPPEKGDKVMQRLVPKTKTAIAKKRAIKVTGPNGNYILLPTTKCFNNNIGEGDLSFWTSTKDVNKEGFAFALKYLLKFTSDEEWIATQFDKGMPFRRSIFQKTALCIRPVADKKWQGHI